MAGAAALQCLNALCFIDESEFAMAYFYKIGFLIRNM